MIDAVKEEGVLENPLDFGSQAFEWFPEFLFYSSISFCFLFHFYLFFQEICTLESDYNKSSIR